MAAPGRWFFFYSTVKGAVVDAKLPSHGPVSVARLEGMDSLVHFGLCGLSLVFDAGFHGVELAMGSQTT